jgi:hypothetical protein
LQQPLPPVAPVVAATVAATTPEAEAKTDTDQKQKEGTREVALVPPDWPDGWFDLFWAKYPNKVDRAGSMKSLAKVAKKGDIEFARIMTGLDRYITKTDDRPWCNPTTWINQSRWDEQHATVRPNNGKAKTGGSIIEALRNQAEFFDRQADAERAAFDDLETSGDDVLRIRDE